MRLTCPSVWYKRILLSRTQVEQSYSHGLRRWAGYQRFLLEMDDDRSPEPFRQTLELMIKDAEKKADIIDDVIRNVGNTDGGVLNRISEYENHSYKPHRHDILHNVDQWKRTERSLHERIQSHRAVEGQDNRQVDENSEESPRFAVQMGTGDEPRVKRGMKSSPRKKSSGKRKYQSDINKLEQQQHKLAQAAKEIQEEWAILQRERTKFLADNLMEFVDRLSISEDKNSDEQPNDCLLSESALELSFQTLLPHWKQEIDNSLHDLFSVGDPEGEMESGSDTRAQRKRHTSGGSSKVTNGDVKLEAKDEKDVTSVEKDAEKQTNANPIKFPKVEKQPVNRPKRYPTAVTTLEARPLAPRECVRWSDMGSSSVAKTPTSNYDIIRKFLNRGLENYRKATDMGVETDNPRGDAITIPSLPLIKMETSFCSVKVVKMPATTSTQTHHTEGTQTKSKFHPNYCPNPLRIGGLGRTGDASVQSQANGSEISKNVKTGHFLPGLSATRSGPLNLQRDTAMHNHQEDVQISSEQDGHHTTTPLSPSKARRSRSKRDGSHLSSVEKKLRVKSNTLRLPSLNIPSIALHNSLDDCRNQ